MEKKAKRSGQAAGTALALMAALLWSLNAPLIKSLEMDAYLLAGLRALIAGLALLPFLRPKRIKWGWPVLAMMVIYVLQSLFIVLAIKMTSAPIAVGMQYTAPVWLYLIAFLKKEPVSRGHLVPLGVLMAGVVISMFSRAGDVTLAGNVIALVSGIWFALLTYTMQYTGGSNPLGMVCINNLFMAAVMLAFCGAGGRLAAVRTLDAWDWILLLFLGIFQFGGGYVCYNLCLQRLSASRASMITPLEMVFGPLWVAVFLRQYPDIIGLTGFIIITAGVLLEIVYTLRREKAALRALER